MLSETIEQTVPSLPPLTLFGIYFSLIFLGHLCCVGSADSVHIIKCITVCVSVCMCVITVYDYLCILSMTVYVYMCVCAHVCVCVCVGGVYGLCDSTAEFICAELISRPHLPL